MGNHHSKIANIRGFYLAHNMLLGLNELTYSLPILYMFLFTLVTVNERPLALNQTRQSNVFLGYQQCIALLNHGTL
jgi:hypothetical protein